MNNINEKLVARGDITAKFYDQRTLTGWEKAYNLSLLALRSSILPVLSGIKRVNFLEWFGSQYRLGTMTFCDEHKNVICNNGFSAVTKRLVGDFTYTGEITKAALGTGVGSASASDTQLITEAYRNDVISGSALGNIAYLTVLFTEAECSGTYKEFGNFIDGLAGVNTGMLWSHLAGLNWAKDLQTALVISCKYTLVSA